MTYTGHLLSCFEMQSKKKKMILSSSDSQAKWILWTYFHSPSSESDVMKTQSFTKIDFSCVQIQMYSVDTKTAICFLGELMNQRKFPSTGLSLHISIIMNMIQSR